MTRPFPTDEQINAINEAVAADALEHMALSGMFCQEISTGGKTAQMLVYLPEKLPHGCCSVFVLMPAGCGAEAFLEKAGWTALADREKFAVLGLELPEGAEDALELQEQQLQHHLEQEPLQTDLRMRAGRLSR